MKKNCLFLLLLFLGFDSHAQVLSQVSFSNGADFLWFTISTSQNVLIRINADGNILEYGIEERALNNKNYFAQKLQPYAGRVNYYQNEHDSTLNGKIKNIATCFFTYYSSGDYPERAGKIKSAGALVFDYYRKFEDALLSGRIKKIGFNAIAYYTSFEQEEFRGKLKTVGTTLIAYYSTFDDVVLKGKLKTIGTFRCEWYIPANTRTFSGVLKSGLQRQQVNGVTYVLQ